MRRQQLQEATEQPMEQVALAVDDESRESRRHRAKIRPGGRRENSTI